MNFEDGIPFDGGYGRKGLIWGELRECLGCRQTTYCICMDGSGDEYAAGAVCKSCAAQLLWDMNGEPK